MSDVVGKLWSFCHILRHDGIDYGDYIEQLTYLLFLKMADERRIDLSKMTFVAEGGDTVSVNCSWPAIAGASGTALTDHYISVLQALGKQKGLLGEIFSGAVSKFASAVNLRTLVGLIEETEWTELNLEVKAAAFEGLLEKTASEGKKGAGQYFTPRILIQSIIRCVQPDPRAHEDFTVCDPACGTGGFLTCAYEWFVSQTSGAMDRELARRIKTDTYFGQELVTLPRRLALMNLYLHGLEPQIAAGDSIYEVPNKRRFNVVLTNPPFGTRGASQVPNRDDFKIATSNKQLNFIQHVLTILKPGGRAAVIVPDNCLFTDQAGELFEILSQECNLHTVLRLPSGTFSHYSPGTQTSVIFFSKGYPTERMWVYDARTNVQQITKKDRPLAPEHLREFENCFGADPNGKAKRQPEDSKEDRWRSFPIAEIKQRNFKIDGFKWLKDELLDQLNSDIDPSELALDAIAELEAAVEDLNAILATLDDRNGNREDAHTAAGNKA